jgi:hypothetical protein
MVLRQLQIQGAPPASWKEAGNLYLYAMNEMYRAQQRSRGGRAYLLYVAKRLEFALEYLGALENVRLAGEARRKSDRGQAVSLLEKAVEGMYNALAALGEHARDNGDRGLIAVLNAYGYRPLKQEVDRQEKEANSGP